MPSRHALHTLRVAVLCIDGCSIGLAFALVPAIYPALHPAPLGTPTALHITVYVAGWLILLAAYRLYDPEYILDGFQQYTRVAQASTMGLLLVGLVALLNGGVLVPRHWLLTSWLVAIVALGLARYGVRRSVRRLRRRGLFLARMLIVGAGEDGLAISEQIGAGMAEVAGFLDEYSAIGTPVGRHAVLGEPLALADIARQVGATDAIIVPQAISWESLQVLLQGGADAWGLQRLWLAPAFRDLLTTGMEVHQRGSLPLLSVAGPRLTGLEAALKRGFDLMLALIALPIAVPLGLLIAAWLLVARRVAPLARHEVIGANRRRFALLTFAPLPELRRAHLWRLPALINLLAGQLSLVGPRPIDRALGERYRPWQVMLTSVRPGLSGPWWLLSGSARLSVEVEVGLDLAYIRNYSIWSDVRVLALTARRLLTLKHSQEVPLSAPEIDRGVLAPANPAAGSGGIL